MGERYLARFYGRCDLVLTPSQAIADDLERASPGLRTAVWGRGVDRSVFSPAHRDLAWRRAQGFADDDVVVAFFGRLVLEKGTVLFADVIAELRRRGRRIVPLVIGDGPERARLEEMLGEAVFTGHVEGRDLSRAIASAEVVVNPSVTEAFGNVNLEAMSAGPVVIAADVPVTRNMIDDGETGVLVEANTVPAFSEATERLMADAALRRAIAARAQAAAQAYDWTAILDGVVAEYRALVKPEALHAG